MDDAFVDVNAMVNRMLGRSNELRPCKVCGGKAKIADETNWVSGKSRGSRWKYIYCETCGCRTNRFFWDDREEMVNEWNGR